MDATQNIRYGYCQCGCGQKTAISPNNNRRYGYVRGEPRKFRHGHHQGYINRQNLSEAWIEEDTGHTTPCWIWTKSVTAGYGRIGHSHGQQSLVHRVLYEREHGPIPPKMELDHLCNISLCVRPDHLEVVTHQENLRRHHQRERMEWDLLIAELRRVGDANSQIIVERIVRRRELTERRTTKIKEQQLRRHSRS